MCSLVRLSVVACNLHVICVIVSKPIHVHENRQESGNTQTRGVFKKFAEEWSHSYTSISLASSSNYTLKISVFKKKHTVTTFFRELLEHNPNLKVTV